MTTDPYVAPNRPIPLPSSGILGAMYELGFLYYGLFFGAGLLLVICKIELLDLLLIFLSADVGNYQASRHEPCDYGH
jgi:hypothetical protein